MYSMYSNMHDFKNILDFYALNLTREENTFSELLLENEFGNVAV